jgi:hypothetical protein
MGLRQRDMFENNYGNRGIHGVCNIALYHGLTPYGAISVMRVSDDTLPLEKLQYEMSLFRHFAHT